jgi:hypothetical protein
VPDRVQPHRRDSFRLFVARLAQLAAEDVRVEFLVAPVAAARLQVRADRLQEFVDRAGDRHAGIQHQAAAAAQARQAFPHDAHRQLGAAHAAAVAIGQFARVEHIGRIRHDQVEVALQAVEQVAVAGAQVVQARQARVHHRQRQRAGVDVGRGHLGVREMARDGQRTRARAAADIQRPRRSRPEPGEGASHGADEAVGVRSEEHRVVVIGRIGRVEHQQLAQGRRPQRRAQQAAVGRNDARFAHQRQQFRRQLVGREGPAPAENPAQVGGAFVAGPAVDAAVGRRCHRNGTVSMVAQVLSDGDQGIGVRACHGS